MSKIDLRARPMFARTEDDRRPPHHRVHRTRRFAGDPGPQWDSRSATSCVSYVYCAQPRSSTNGVEETLPPAVPAEQQALLGAITGRHLGR